MPLLIIETKCYKCSFKIYNISVNINLSDQSITLTISGYVSKIEPTAGVW